MYTSNRQRFLAHSFIAASLGLTWPCVTPGQTQEKGKGKADEKFTLQYRIAMDMWAPSRFIAVIGDGVTSSLEITWDISSAEKRELDAFINKMEKKQINVAEFECRGRWEEGGGLRVTTVPKLTERGKKRIREWVDVELGYVQGRNSYAAPPSSGDICRPSSARKTFVRRWHYKKTLPECP